MKWVAYCMTALQKLLPIPILAVWHSPMSSSPALLLFQAQLCTENVHRSSLIGMGKNKDRQTWQLVSKALTPWWVSACTTAVKSLPEVILCSQLPSHRPGSHPTQCLQGPEGSSALEILHDVNLRKSFLLMLSGQRRLIQRSLLKVNPDSWVGDVCAESLFLLLEYEEKVK